MAIALLADIGSTFTKMSAVDLQGGLIATAQAPTTVAEGIQHGLLAAEAKVLTEASVSRDKVTLRLSSSSAAGGLRMITLGLVPELTAEAAKLAALGAGARVLKVFAYKLTRGDVKELVTLAPDIVLLAGGADGGDTETAIHNASALAASTWRGPVIYAGNRLAADEIEELLSPHGMDVIVVSNVMPKLGSVDVDQARQAIREVFFKTIVHNKGFDKAAAWSTANIMPTPLAVQRGVALTAEIFGNRPILAFDVGGATTDVYSVGGNTVRDKAFYQGLSTPYEMRTVEGDLGVRVSLEALLDAAPRGVQQRHGLDPMESERWVQKVKHTTSVDLPMEVDTALAAICVELAATRHAGTMEMLPTPFGYTGIQRGKDLKEIGAVIGTGGLLSRMAKYDQVLKSCQASAEYPLSLLPASVTAYQDRRYIIYAAGLIKDQYPYVAKRLVAQSLSL